MLDAVGTGSPFYRLFDCIENLSFFAKDHEGVLLAANEHLVKLYEFETEAELIGHTDFDLLPRRLAEKYRRDDLNIMASRQPITRIVELFLNPQGIPSWYMTSKYPIISRRDKVLGIMGIIQDYQHYRRQFPGEQDIQEAMDHIYEHYREKISVKALAAMCQISLRQFERKFRSYFNLTPQQYIIKMRIHESCELLSKQDAPIGSIAMELGFYDQSSFTMQFKKTMGLTPPAIPQAVPLKANATAS